MRSTAANRFLLPGSRWACQFRRSAVTSHANTSNTAAEQTYNRQPLKQSHLPLNYNRPLYGFTNWLFPFDSGLEQKTTLGIWRKILGEKAKHTCSEENLLSDECIKYVLTVRSKAASYFLRDRCAFLMHYHIIKWANKRNDEQMFTWVGIESQTMYTL